MRFDMTCDAHGVEQRLTKLNHPVSLEDQQTARGTIFLLYVKRFRHQDRHQLRAHLSDYQAANNYARRLKTLNGLTPCEYIWKIRTSAPEIFQPDPIPRRRD